MKRQRQKDIPADTQQGGKGRRRGKNDEDIAKRELIFKEDGQGELYVSCGMRIWKIKSTLDADDQVDIGMRRPCCFFAQRAGYTKRDAFSRLGGYLRTVFRPRLENGMTCLAGGWHRIAHSGRNRIEEIQARKEDWKGRTAQGILPGWRMRVRCTCGAQVREPGHCR